MISEIDPKRKRFVRKCYKTVDYFFRESLNGLWTFSVGSVIISVTESTVGEV